jgi:hypothetical protein
LKRSAVVLLLLALAGLPIAAQYEDEGTEDYEEQDRRYLERMKHAKQQAPPESPIEDPSEEFLQLAEKLVRDKNYDSAETARYRVQSDDPRLDADATARLLEQFRDFFEGYWQGPLELEPYDKTSRVFLIYSFHKYNQLLGGDFRFSKFRPQGHYGSSYDVISLHSDSDGGEGATADGLIHEATHQLVDQAMFGALRTAPIWLSEGLASYFGYTRYDGDGFHPGVAGGKAVAIFRGSRGTAGDAARNQLKDFHRSRKLFERIGDELLVEHLLAVDTPGGFYGEQPQLHYAGSWLLVHTLLHAESGRFREGFERYIALEAAGEGGPAVLYQETGLDPDRLQAVMDQHVRKIKTR